jgi:hypothetical protein
MFSGRAVWYFYIFDYHRSACLLMMSEKRRVNHYIYCLSKFERFYYAVLRQGIFTRPLGNLVGTFEIPVLLGCLMGKTAFNEEAWSQETI